jgi:3-methyladenine DNA glycosylase AlkC
MFENRKGAKNIASIPSDVLKALEAGAIPTVNLMEWLATDRLKLLWNVLTELNLTILYPEFTEALESVEKKTAIARAKAIASVWVQHLNSERMAYLSNHVSDMVREWAALSVGLITHTTIKQKLEKIEFFAIDPHFGVREMAWISVRDQIIESLEESIEILTDWAASDLEGKRRFASESTRPRGVWCKHIEILKSNPEKGLSILEPLKNDPSRYVQNSVANWLNDAAKTQPEFVRTLCIKWESEHPKSKQTNYIINRALRSIKS